MIWAISLLIGVLVGREHETGTVFFLLAGVAFVLFITCFEYDVAPTAPLKTSLWTWRPADASGMRHILLHKRKFDLSIICVLSALLTSCIVYSKDADALNSGLEGFLLSIVTLAIALFILFGLRALVSLSADIDEEMLSNKGGSGLMNHSDQNLSGTTSGLLLANGESSPLLGNGQNMSGNHGGQNIVRARSGPFQSSASRATTAYQHRPYSTQTDAESMASENVSVEEVD